MMSQSIEISTNIKKSLQKSAPDVLDTYKSCLELLEDIEIND
jgi:hypothetical protein